MFDYDSDLPPPPFAHRDSPQDIADYKKAKRLGTESALFSKWIGEDLEKETRAAERSGIPTPNTKKLDNISDNIAALKDAAEKTAKPWLDKKEAAEYLGVSTRTIDRARSEGKLKGHLLDGTTTTRYKREDLDGLMG